MKCHNLHRVKLALIEDDDIYISIILNRLNNIGIENINIFKSGEAFFESDKKNPDIIILDYNLEKKMNGLDVLKKIKECQIKTKVILFTNEHDDAIYKTCLANGAIDFIEKGLYSFGKLEVVVSHIANQILESRKLEKRSVLQYIISLFW
ncbi:MAG TPA: hypothetical protein DDX39_09675 [Bacteroidales bacterium]|nr:MAG: hypothetical protein A2W98_01700 [Bacteroidetes bacterium GWF2_33_38]OFY74349.1 MAG: hypothetical protein A2265_06240 [Bacteroidetes bacterium RIFOXYA12_FULL_33_9]OFY84732.1 MAG: hypothetical protein A2236_04970 [Bacteroidetes bacterium RIFOXYA2_FULL_33_7]HBF88897.1 hypothetical protein [Bacteroidales bacterium]